MLQSIRKKSRLSGAKKFKAPVLDAVAFSTRHKRGKIQPGSELGHALVDLLESKELTQEELAELLSAETKMDINRSRLVGWISGATPRGDVDVLMKAIKRLSSRKSLSSEGTWVPHAEVAQTIGKWRKTLTDKQICIVSEIAPSTLAAWADGSVKVRRRRWNRVVAYVDLWQENIKAAQSTKS